MEEQKDKKTCDCMCCKRGMGMGMGMGHGGWYGFVILRIVIMILIVGAAFWIGVQLGTLRGELYGAGYGSRMMRSYGGYGTNAPMMQDNAAPSTSAQ